MKNSTSRLDEALPKDVHDALSYVLKAYSIFTPNPQLPLFQAVLVNPERDHRHKSPQATPLNLEAIVYEARNIPEMRPSPECQHIIDTLDKEISERVEPPHTRPMCSDLEHVESELSVSISSLIRAEVTGIVPEVNVAVFGRFSREKRHAAKLKLTSQKSRRYTGSYLGLFLWEQGEFLFRRMLFYLHRDLGITTGDRRLLAFVTKHIYGTVSVSTSEIRDIHARVAVPAPIIGCLRGAIENEANCTNMGGVIGIHFIAFPVEKVGDHTWRFFRPIEVVDEENTGSDSILRFHMASKWARGEKGVHLHDAAENKDVCSDFLERTESTESTDSTTTDASSTYEDSIGSESFQDVSLPEPIRDWINVDLGESVQELARRQVAVAKHYKDLKDESKSGLISNLLRNAIAAGNKEAASELLASRKEREARLFASVFKWIENANPKVKERVGILLSLFYFFFGVVLGVHLTSPFLLYLEVPTLFSEYPTMPVFALATIRFGVWMFCRIFLALLAGKRSHRPMLQAILSAAMIVGPEFFNKSISTGACVCPLLVCFAVVITFWRHIQQNRFQRADRGFLFLYSKRHWIELVSACAVSTMIMGFLVGIVEIYVDASGMASHRSQELSKLEELMRDLYFEELLQLPNYSQTCSLPNFFAS